MRVSVVFAAAGLALAVTASATACSAGSKAVAGGAAATGADATSAAAGTGASSAAAASSAAGNSGSSGTVKNFEVCTALTAAAASQITGTTFTTTKPGSVAGQIFSCEYGGANSALLQISVITVGGKIDYNADVSSLKTVGFPPNSVTGVGDEAFSMPDPKTAGSLGASSFASYGAVFGDVYIKIGGLTYVTPAQGKQIVEELHAKL
jgi:hypothetical protein